MALAQQDQALLEMVDALSLATSIPTNTFLQSANSSSFCPYIQATLAREGSPAHRMRSYVLRLIRWVHCNIVTPKKLCYFNEL